MELVNKIDEKQIYAARAVADKDGNQIDSTYAKSSDVPSIAGLMAEDKLGYDESGKIKSYDGTEFAGTDGKTYTGISPVIVDNTNDTVSVETEEISAGDNISIANGVISVTGMPTKTSDLENDSGFLTEHQSLAGLMEESKLGYDGLGKIATYDGIEFAGTGGSVEISAGDYIDITNGVISVTGMPTKTSDLENDSDFAKRSEIPTVPTNVGAFTNDVGYLTEHQSLAGLMEESKLEYNDNNEITGYNGSEFAGDKNDTFVAVFNQTSYDELLAAYNAGKAIMAVKDGYLYVLSSCSSTNFNFTSIRRWTAVEDISYATMKCSKNYGWTTEGQIYSVVAKTATNISAYYNKTEIDNTLTAYAKTEDIPTVPTNVGAFTNDVGYLTAHQSLDGYATETWVNNNNYATQNFVTNITDNKLDTSAFSSTSGDFALKTEIPTVPTNVGAFTNDVGYLTAHQSLDGLMAENKLTLEDGKYTKYDGVPFAGQGGSGKTYTGVAPVVVDNDEDKISVETADVDYQQIVHDDSLVHVSNNAQYALGVNTNMFKDETVLWEGEALISDFPITLSESYKNFESIKFVSIGNYDSTRQSPLHVNEFYTDKPYFILQMAHANNTSLFIDVWNLKADTDITVSSVNAVFYSIYSSTSSGTQNGVKMYKVIGIGRKGGN